MKMSKNDESQGDTEVMTRSQLQPNPAGLSFTGNRRRGNNALGHNSGLGWRLRLHQ